MKKKIAALLAAACLSGSLSASAAPKAYDDVPVGHWAYASIEKLADAGLLAGSPIRKFDGEKPALRYEMAVLTARAYAKAKREPAKLTPEIKEALDRLGKEYSTELGNLGVRLKALEKYKPAAQFFGDVRVRYIVNKENIATNKSRKNGSTWEHRVRLGYRTPLTDDWKFTARMEWGGSDDGAYDGIEPGALKGDYTGDIFFSMAYLTYAHGKFSADLGRLDNKLGQGTVAGSTQDGAFLTYEPDKKTMLHVGYASASPHLLGAHDWNYDADNKSEENMYYGQHVPFFEASIGRQIGIGYWTLSHLKTFNQAYDIADYKWIPNDSYSSRSILPLVLDQYAVGVKIPLPWQLTLSGEWVTNRAGSLASVHDRPVDRNGYWVQLSHGWFDQTKKGTHQLDLIYLDIGNCALDSEFYPHSLWVNGGNYFGRDGEKGVGVNLMYTIFPNVVLAADYYWLRPTADGANFSRYRSPWQVALNYFF